MFEFHHPTRFVFGPASLSKAGEAVASLGTQAMIVCDPFATETGLAQKLQETLKQAGVASVIYDQVIPNPTTTLVDAGGQLARAEKCNVIIGLGGGSSMDSAKGIAVSATHEGPIWPYVMGEKEVTDKTLPVVAITTTSGTGSQCTGFSVITNPETNQKPGMGSPYILPKVAIVDPELTSTMPPRLTAATGIDVFTHAVEAYTSQWASPLTDMYAEKAISLVARYLPVCFKDGSNLEARQAMAVADTCAGVAISHAAISVAHVIAHVISGHYHDIAHGDALNCIYRETLRLNAPGLPEKHQWIAEQLCPGSTDVAEAYETFFSQFQQPNCLKDKNPDAAIVRTLAEETFTYMKLYAELGPICPTVDDVEKILTASLA